MVRWATIVLSFVGLVVGVWAVSTAKQTPPDLPLARQASVNPFASGVASLGLVEPGSRSVAIAAPEAGLVIEVLVDVGDKVEAGQPLLRLDARRLEADLIRARAAVRSGEEEIRRWHALPRTEDIPPLEAAVARAEAAYGDRAEQLRLTEDAAKRGAATERDVSVARFVLAGAKAEMDGARAELAKMKAGGWEPDLAVATASLERLKAEVAALTTLQERYTVTAPRAGTVLRRQVEPGEYTVGGVERPALIIGDLTMLHVRAQVDEEDIALVGDAPRAVARTRGAMVKEIPLSLVRIEPYARPKTNLAGMNIERVDTRVVDVVFRVEGTEGARLFPGQAVDVFIESAPR